MPRIYSAAELPEGWHPSWVWYRFVTQDDERRCPVCAPLHYALINGVWDWLRPPMHNRCRCVWVFDHADIPEDDGTYFPEDPPTDGPGTGGGGGVGLPPSDPGGGGPF